MTVLKTPSVRGARSRAGTEQVLRRGGRGRTPTPHPAAPAGSDHDRSANTLVTVASSARASRHSAYPMKHSHDQRYEVAGIRPAGLAVCRSEEYTELQSSVCALLLAPLNRARWRWPVEVEVTSTSVVAHSGPFTAPRLLPSKSSLCLRRSSLAHACMHSAHCRALHRAHARPGVRPHGAPATLIESRDASRTSLLGRHITPLSVTPRPPRRARLYSPLLLLSPGFGRAI